MPTKPGFRKLGAMNRIDPEPSPTDVVRFHSDQIDRILEESRGMQNMAWQASIESAVSSMERGLYAWLRPKRAAAQVMEKALIHRQQEPGPTSRWYLASLVESLAALRVLSIRYRKQAFHDAYRRSKNSILKSVKEAR